MSPHPTITERVVGAAKPPERGTIMLWDGALKHFGVRISRGGSKAFIVLLGSGRRQTIGQYPMLSIADARAKAKHILAERTLGRYATASTSWQKALADYLDHAKLRLRPSTFSEYQRILKRHFLFGTRRLTEIRRIDISRKLDALKTTPAQCGKAFVVVKTFFNWAIKRGYLDVNPCTMAVVTKSPARSRVLTGDELKAVWQTCNDCEDLPDRYRAIVKLLILTGQRRGEITGLCWNWIDEKTKTITLPAEITKNKRVHTFPYGDMTAAILAAMPRLGEYVFPAAYNRLKDRPATVLNGWSKPKDILDKACPLAPWTLHDLRRTCATNLAALGTPVHVTEKLLNHVSGTTGGIVGIYQRHAYMDEMRAAIVAWEERLACLLNDDQVARATETNALLATTSAAESLRL